LLLYFIQFNLTIMKNRSFPNLILYKGIISIFIVLQVNILRAQNDEMRSKPESNFISRLFYGGGFGLQFGSVTLIEVSPLVGYKVTPKLGIGISPSYKYYSYKNPYYPSSRLETNVFGGSVFARYMIFENIFAHAEYESLFYNTKVPGYPVEMQQYNSVLVGGGYRQMIGGNAAMNILVLWNLNDTPDSPYTNPVIRIGFTVGM